MDLDLNSQNLVACLCEGTAEQAVINLLLDADALIFSRSQLLEEKPIKTRGAKEFERRYLRNDFESPVTVLRILDSHNEKFRLSAAYQHQVKEIYNVVTAPEIEILIIIAEGKYSHYSNKVHGKPSDYCIQQLHMGRKIKQEDFVKSYFRDSSKLIESIQQYAKLCKIKANEYCLNDLLKVGITPYNL